MFAICSPSTGKILEIVSEAPITSNVIISLNENHEACRFLGWYKLNISHTGLELDLNGVKVSRINELATETNTLIEARYPAHRQRTLTLLLVQAIASGLINRINYIQSGLFWGIEVMTWYYQHEDMILSLNTRETILNYTWDFSTLPPDPNVTIKSSLAISN
jgi:hypothetical protein